ncbi:MAG: cupin domain-containing protein [Bacillota bacterium]
MKLFDLNKMEVHPYEQRQKNVFYKSKEFKSRLIKLPAQGEMPKCEMDTYVMFYVLDGEGFVTVNGETKNIKSGQCMITEPAELSLKTDKGMKLMGIQINKTE